MNTAYPTSPRDAARLLGGDVYRDRILCPGPGHSPGDRSLEVWFKRDAPDGFLVRTFSPADDPLACKDYIRKVLGLAPWSPRPWTRARPILRDLPRRAAPIVVDDDQVARIRLALSIWHGARDLRGSLAEQYLRSRGLDVSENLRHALRFAPALRLDGGTVAGMVALLRDCVTGVPCGIHRTFLTADGSKLDRRMLGRQGVVELSPREEVGLGLGLAEGIEDGLAVLSSGWQPVWAATSAGAIAKFPVIAGIDALTVFGDDDEAGNNAATECAGRWIEHGREAATVLPPHSEVSL